MEIAAYERFGPVSFGASEEEVVGVLGPPDSAFDLELIGGRQLNYPALGVHVTIDADDRCESVESVEPAYCVVVVDGDLRLVGEVGPLVEALRQRGLDARDGWEDGDIVCDALGVIFGPEFAPESETQEVESVCAFRQDTYHQVLQMDRELHMELERRKG